MLPGNFQLCCIIWSAEDYSALMAVLGNEWEPPEKTSIAPTKGGIRWHLVEIGSVASDSDSRGQTFHLIRFLGAFGTVDVKMYPNYNWLFFCHFCWNRTCLFTKNKFCFGSLQINYREIVTFWNNRKISVTITANFVRKCKHYSYLDT